MKYAVSALALVATLGAALGVAQAADLPSHKAPPPAYVPPPPSFTWSGPYVGVNIGAAFFDNHNNGWNGWGNGWGWGNNNDSVGVAGGGQIGYNYQFSPLFVIGLETDFQGSSLGSGNQGNWFFAAPRRQVDWFGTVRGRAGVSLLDAHLLLYGTGGFAYGDVRRGLFGNYSSTDTGWTAGGGVEWAFLPNWSAKFEYLYTDLGRNENNWWGFTPRSETRFHTVRAGVNYHFNLFGAGPSPVVAKY